jgi:hypothetical protein
MLKATIFLILNFTLSSFAKLEAQRALSNRYFTFDSNKSKYFLDNQGDTVISTFLSTQKTFNEKKYFVEELRDRYGMIEVLYRTQDGEVMQTQDGYPEETLLLPSMRYVGQVWFTAMKTWRLKVVSTKASLKIGDIKYKKLLQIQEYDLELPSDTAIYFSYYQKNVGLIARTRNGEFDLKYVK